MGNLIGNEVDEIVGKDEKDADEYLKSKNMYMRVLENDNEGLIGDCLFDENRVNVSVKKGKVIEIIGVG